jgi:tetratricopeptide (TPR) repeat protein
LAYSHLQRFDQARDCYFRAIDKHAGHIDAYLHVGLDYAASGDLRIAIPWLFRAHSLAPDRTDIAYALAEQLIALEYFNTAKEVIDQALEAHLRDGLIIVVDGDLNLAKGDVAAATACYEKARAEQPKLAAALVGLAQAKASQGKDLEAKALLKDALSADPENPIVNGEAGLLEARSGDWNAALEHLNRAWAQDHSDTKIALELARTYRRRNKPQDALRLLSSFSPDMRTSSAFHLELAQIYTQLHRISEAQAERDAVNNLQAQAHDALHFENPRTYVH